MNFPSSVSASTRSRAKANRRSATSARSLPPPTATTAEVEGRLALAVGRSRAPTAIPGSRLSSGACACSAHVGLLVGLAIEGRTQPAPDVLGSVATFCRYVDDF